MTKEIMNLFFFVGFVVAVYYIFRNFSYKEGMTTATTDTSANGIAGNAASYAATIKTATVQLQDALLISKYSSDYETAILNLDDLINNLMLNAALSVNPSSPDEPIKQLAVLQQAKTALNSVMKYVDSQ